jgi:hypothetical protein
MSWHDHGPEDEAARRQDGEVCIALDVAIHHSLLAAVNERANPQIRPALVGTT